jgi:hypothetical protein
MLLQRSCFSLLVLLAVWELGMAAVMLTWSCNNCPYSTNVRSASNHDICILRLRLHAPLTSRNSVPAPLSSWVSIFLSHCRPVLSLYPFICLPVLPVCYPALSLSSPTMNCLPVYLPSSLSVFRFLCLPVPLSSGPSVFLSLCLLVPLSFSPSVFWSLCLPVPLSSSVTLNIFYQSFTLKT